MNNILIEKFEDMNENPNFEQDYYSKRAIYDYRHGIIRLMNWLAQYNRSYYVNTCYYELMGSDLKF